MTAKLLDICMVQNSGDLPDQTIHSDTTFHELVYVLGGEYQVEIGDERHTAGPGEVFFYPAGLGHRPLLRRDLGVRLYVVQWREEPPPDPLPALRSRDTSGRLLLLFQWMWDVYPPKDSGQRQLSDQLFRTLLLAHRVSVRKPASGFSEQVKHYMLRDLNRPLTLLEVSTAFGVSEFHLIRRFKKETGVTPGAWLRQQRIRKAVALLVNTADPLKVIAKRVGFSSTSHLRKLVRRETGRTPEILRRGKAT